MGSKMKFAPANLLLSLPHSVLIIMILNRAFPLDAPSLKSFRYTMYAALCVFLILVLLQPFGLDELSTSQRIVHSFLYGLVTFVIASANTMLLPVIFRQVYNEQRWTVGKELLHMCWQIVSIAMGNLLLTHWLYNTSLSWHNLFMFLWITLAVGIFPLWLNILFKQQRLLKKYQAGAASIDRQLHEPNAVTENKTDLPAAITFTSESGKEQVTIEINDIRFISSADNYVRIFYVQQNKPATHLLRNTLRKAEEMVTAYPRFFRCHRTFIVNLSAVEHVSGNAQGYKLHLKDVEELIPVSRNLNAALSEQLALRSRPGN